MTERTNHTILITGAAKRVGAALARHFAAAGHGLVLHYHRSKDEAEALAAELRAQTEVTLVQADLTDTGKLEGFWQGLPSVDAFIHNASRFERDTLATLTAESLRAHLAVHLEAPLLLAKGFLAQLPKGASGNIVILGDGELGWSLGPNFFSYAVSKHAWQSVIDLLAAAALPQARANMVALGATLPSLHDTPESFEKLRDKIPLRRLSGPQEVCAAVDYLLAAPNVTGQVISLAGGWGLATLRRGTNET